MDSLETLTRNVVEESVSQFLFCKWKINSVWKNQRFCLFGQISLQSLT